MGWLVRVYSCYYLRPTILQRESLNGQWWLSRLLGLVCNPTSTPALHDPALSLVIKTFYTHLLCRSMLFQMFYIVQGTLQNKLFLSHWNKPFPLSLPNIDRDIRISSVNSWEAHVNIYITLRVDITDSYSLIDCLWDVFWYYKIPLLPSPQASQNCHVAYFFHALKLHTFSAGHQWNHFFLLI